MSSALVAGILALAGSATLTPSQTKDLVGLVYVADEAGGRTPRATGFFVGVPLAGAADQVAVYFLTTRRAVLDPGGRLRARIFVRLQTGSGGFGFAEVALASSGPNPTAFLPPDPSVDLVAIPLLPDTHAVRFRFLPLDLLADRATLAGSAVTEGTPVFFTGALAPRREADPSHRVVRFGRIALLGGQRLMWHGVASEMYLIAPGAGSGHDGSPVFLQLPAQSTPGGAQGGDRRVQLGGMIAGSLSESPTTATPPVSGSRAGLAAVVPSTRIRELLAAAQAARDSTGR